LTSAGSGKDYDGSQSFCEAACKASEEVACPENRAGPCPCRVLRMDHDLLSPTSDIVFRMLFGSERNTDVLIAFLKEVLLLPGDDLAEVAIMNPILDSDLTDVKASILDIKAKTALGKRIDIEMQMDNHPELRQRIMFYMAKMFSEQAGPGDDYNLICPVVCILITDFRMIENAYYHNRYRLHDPRTGSEFTDLLKLLPAVREAASDYMEGD